MTASAMSIAESAPRSPGMGFPPRWKQCEAGVFELPDLRKALLGQPRAGQRSRVRAGLRTRCPSSPACRRTSRAGRGRPRRTGRGRNGRTRNGRRAAGARNGRDRAGRRRRGPVAGASLACAGPSADGAAFTTLTRVRSASWVIRTRIALSGACFTALVRASCTTRYNPCSTRGDSVGIAPRRSQRTGNPEATARPRNSSTAPSTGRPAPFSVPGGSRGKAVASPGSTGVAKELPPPPPLRPARTVRGPWRPRRGLPGGRRRWSAGLPPEASGRPR